MGAVLGKGDGEEPGFLDGSEDCRTADTRTPESGVRGS